MFRILAGDKSAMVYPSTGALLSAHCAAIRMQKARNTCVQYNERRARNCSKSSCTRNGGVHAKKKKFFSTMFTLQCIGKQCCHVREFMSSIRFILDSYKGVNAWNNYKNLTHTQLQSLKNEISTTQSSI